MSTLKATNIQTDNIDPKTSWVTDEIAGNTIKQSDAGKVLQVVQNVVAASTMSGAQSDAATDYFVTITPSSTSSKILVSFTGIIQGHDIIVGWIVKRSIGGAGYTSTASTETYTGIADRGGYYNSGNLACQVLDSPSTTSPVTYKIYITSTSGNVHIGRDLGSTYDADTQCTAMEIAG